VVFVTDCSSWSRAKSATCNSGPRSIISIASGHIATSVSCESDHIQTTPFFVLRMRLGYAMSSQKVDKLGP
jgi:hypothetical protein